MRILATGCYRPSLLGRQRLSGFTLIEIMVVMVIIGVLATAVALTLPEQGLSERRASVQAWQIMAETAALQAEAKAQPFAWEVSEREARILVFDQQQWQAPAQPVMSRATLAEGLLVDYLESEGQRLPLGGRIIFAGSPPLFVVAIHGHGRRWELNGLPNGTITLSELP